MVRKAEHPITSVLVIDGNGDDRKLYSEGLKRCSSDYVIYEAVDGESGLNFYRSQPVDCVLLSLELPDCSGFRVLVALIPIARRPRVAVLMLTNNLQRGLQNGAHACFVKQHTLCEDIDRAIKRAMAVVGRLPKEDRYRPF